MTTEDRKLSIKVAAENEASPTFQEIGADADKMAAKVSQAGKKAADGINSIGDGADAAADKLTRAESRMASALRKATEDTLAAAQAGKSLAGAFDLKVDMRGMDASRLQPYIQALRDAESQLSVFKAKEAELAAQNVFAEKHRQAKQLAQSTEYLRFWNQELDRMEAAERKAASQNAFVQSLREQSNAIGKTRADLLELKAVQLGVADQAAPYIAKLRQTETAMTGMGESSKQTAFAMRMLPAQINDVIVSLQGGQAPMTVFLQQGTQVRDMFGGWGIAARSVGSYIAGMVSPLTMSAAAVVALGLAYYQGSKEQDAFLKSLVLSGNASGVTSGQLREYARQMSAVSGTQAKAAESLAAFVAAGVRGGEQLAQYTQTAIQWEKATGQAVGETAKRFADLQKDPLTAVVRLNEEMNFLTASTYEQIKSLSDQGRTMEAAKVAMGALNSEMASSSKTIQQNLGYIEQGWNAITGAAKKAWDTMLNVGRSASIDEKLGAVRKELNALIDQQGWGETGGGAATGRVTEETKRRVQERIEALRAEEWQLEASSLAESMNAAAKAENAKATQSAIKWGELRDQHLSKSQKLTRELTAAQNEYNERLSHIPTGDLAARNKLEKEYQQIQANIKDQYKEKGGGGMSRSESEIATIKSLIANEEELIKRYREHGVAAKDMTDAEKLVSRLQAQRNEATSASVKSEKERALVEAQRLLGLEKERIGLEASAEAKDKQDKANEKHLEQIYKNVAALDDEADRIDASAATFGKARTEIERMTLAKLEARKADLQGLASPEYLAALDQQIKKQQRLVGSLEKLDFTKLDHKYDKALQGARDELAIQQEGLSLLGMDEVERKKIIELRKIELKLRKELAEVDEQYKGRNDAASIEEAEQIKRNIREKAEVDTQIAISKIQEEYALANAQKYNDVFRQGFVDFVNNGVDGLKAFGKSLKTTVLTSVAEALYKAFAQKFVMNVVASITGLIGGGASLVAGAIGGGGGGGVMGYANAASTGYSLYSGQGVIGQGSRYVANMFGWGGSAPWSAAGAQASGAVTYPVGGSVGAAAPGQGGWMSGGADWLASGGWVMAIPMIAAYLGGMFKEERMVGVGLTGELGGDMYGYQLMRESGGWFDGPDYRYVIAEKRIKESKEEIERLKKEIAATPEGENVSGKRVRMQRLYAEIERLEELYSGAIEGSKGPIKVLQDAYTGMREDTASRADSLGLDGDSIRKMKVALGLDKIHPDTGGMGIELTGLSQEEASKKIQQALEQANEEMARSVLGTWETVTHDVTKTIFENVWVADESDAGGHWQRTAKEVTESLTEQVFVMSEYVREGETAVQALTRLSDSLLGVNGVFDLLGATLLEGSLASADWASSLVDAIGSMDTLVQAAATYFDLYYSDSEKRALAAKTADKGMADKGFDLRTSDADAKAKYRALMDKAIAEKDEELIAWLLNFADDFAAGVDAVNAEIEASTNAAAELLQRQAEELERARNETMSAMGISADSLVSGFIQEINEGRGATAGTWLADQIVGGFEKAIYDQAVTTIINSMIDGIITPMVTAALTGSSVSAAVSGAAIDTMIATATAAAEALSTLLSNPEFLEALEKVKGIIGDIGNTIGSSVKPQESARREQQERAAQQAAQERYNLETKLLQLQGNTAALRQRELDALDPSNRALQLQIYAIEDANADQQAYTEALYAAQSAYDSAVSRLQAAQSDVDGIRQQGTQNYLDAQKAVQEAQERIVQIQKDAANEIARTFLDLGKSLRDWLSDQRGTADPSKEFASTLKKALAGDSEAMQNLTSAAQAADAYAKANSASAVEYELERARILAGVGKAAGVAEGLGAGYKAPDELADARAQLLEAQKALAEALRVANAIGAPLVQSPDSLIKQYEAALKELNAASAALTAQQAALDSIKAGVWDTSSKAGGTTDAVNSSSREQVGWLQSLNSKMDSRVSPEHLRLLGGSIDGTTAAVRTGSQSQNAWLERIDDSVKAGTVSNREVLTRFGSALGGSTSSGGSNFGSAQKFASGGIVDSATAFSFAGGRLGIMGEAGPEAIMPTQRMANGDLGIRVQMPQIDWNSYGRDKELVNEIRELRAENRAQAAAMVGMQREIVRLHERWDRNGLPETREVK